MVKRITACVVWAVLISGCNDSDSAESNTDESMDSGTMADDDDTADDDTADDDTADDDTADDDTADDDTADDDDTVDEEEYLRGLVADRPDYTEGQDIFRHDTFGTEVYWTETLRMHEVIAGAVDPVTALSVGLKVDASKLPDGILEEVDLEDPATTVALLSLDAVVGVKGTVVNDELVAVGITCALCHSTVDDSVMEGIGERIDGPANRDLDPGLILSLSSAFDEDTKTVLQTWGPGMFDPRFNQDGINGPVLIPPIYGLEDVELETYTGDGPVSYWNNYVAVTQMGGIGSFEDERLDLSIDADPDYVTDKLPALAAFELSIEAPAPPEDSYDVEAAERGEELFRGAAGCADCHTGSNYTDAADQLHDPEETGMHGEYAERSATGQYRTTPLRALFDHPPYFHDGSAATLADVVAHYDEELGLDLTEEEQSDLTEFLKSL